MLPHSRATYVAGDVLGGSLFCAAQDWAAAFFAGKRRQQSLHLPVFGVRGWWTHTAGDAWVTSTGVAQKHPIPVSLRPGDRVLSAYLGYNRQPSVGGISVALMRIAHAGGAAAASVGGGLVASAPGVWQYDAVTVGHTIEAGYTYWLELAAGAIGDQADVAELVYTHPR